MQLFCQGEFCIKRQTTAENFLRALLEGLGCMRDHICRRHTLSNVTMQLTLVRFTLLQTTIRLSVDLEWPAELEGNRFNINFSEVRRHSLAISCIAKLLGS